MTQLATTACVTSSNDLLASYAQLAQNSSLWGRNPGAALHRLLQEAVNNLDILSAEIWLENDIKSGLLCEISHNINPIPLIENSSIDYAANPNFFDLLKTQPLTIFNSADNKFKSPISHSKHSASIHVSLYKEGQFIGICSFAHKLKLHNWSHEEQQYILLLCGLISPILVHNRLHDNERLHRTIFNSLGDAYFVMVESYFIDCNPAALALFNCNYNQIVGQTPYRFSPIRQPDGQLSSEKAMEKISRAFSGSSQFFEWRFSKFCGAHFDAEVTLTSVTINQLPHIIASIRDITDRKNKEDHLNKMNSIQNAIFDAASYAIISINRDGIIQTFNKTAESLLGYSAEEVIGIHTPEIFHDRQEVIQAVAAKNESKRDFMASLQKLMEQESASGKAVVEREWSYQTKQGKRFPGLLSLTVLKDEQGKASGYLGILSDITEEKRSQEDLLQSKLELEYRANHDSLTGLPNRSHLHEKMNEAITHACIEQNKIALLLLDLNRFKEVNDTLGHCAGDMLLKKVGDQLRNTLRQTKTQIFRLGGDEFAILVPILDHIDKAFNVAETINASLRRPIEVEGVTLELGGSIGIACYPNHGDNSDSLLRCADVAMYRAKSSGTGTVVYDADLDSHTPRRLAIMSELGKAIREDQLVLYFQPRMDLKTHKCVGCEALIRWQHPTLGLIEPEEFIPLAEMSDLIRPLSMWVLRTALHHVKRWNNAGHDLCVAVNVSARNLLDLSYPGYIKQLLSEYNIPPHQLDIEITESAIISDPDRSLRVVDKIHELGVSLAIDDFGTGYSSLSYLKRLPVQLLKIDKSFIQDLIHDEQDAAIVTSTIGLAHSFGLKVVAEGVEDHETLTELQKLGCEYAQGYYFKYPLPGRKFSEWLDIQDLESAQTFT